MQLFCMRKKVTHHRYQMYELAGVKIGSSSSCLRWWSRLYGVEQLLLYVYCRRSILSARFFYSNENWKERAQRRCFPEYVT